MSSCPRVAYFCMEYGLDPSFPIYAGGLGILAGDHMKSVGDLHVPLVGIGLFWDEGYTRQVDRRPAGHRGPVSRRPRATRCAASTSRVEVTVRGKKVPLPRLEGRPLRHVDALPARARARRGSLDHAAALRRRRRGPARAGDRARRRRRARCCTRSASRSTSITSTRATRCSRGSSCCASTAFGGDDADRAAREAAPARRVHDAHAGPRRQRGPRPRPDAQDGRGPRVHRRASSSEIGGDPFSMTVAGLRLVAARERRRRAARRDRARDVEGRRRARRRSSRSPTACTQPTWQDARIRAALVPDKARERQDAELWAAHQRDEARAARGGRARAPARTCSADGLLDRLRAARRRVQARRPDPRRRARAQAAVRSRHPASSTRARRTRATSRARRWSAGSSTRRSKHPGNVVFLENYDMRLGALLTRGADVWLNNPRRPLEASGTCGMKAAMNGVPNLSILDGWWPEGCEHGVTGWKIGDPDPNDDPFDEKDERARRQARPRAPPPRARDRGAARVSRSRARGSSIMRASIAMSQWRFSSDRMIEDYVTKVYSGR